MYLHFSYRSLIKKLQQKGRQVAMSATTGMAAIQLGHSAVTVHSWSGIGRGQRSDVDVFESVKNQKPEAMDRIKKAEVLVIDEIGMLSKRVFDQLHYVVRMARNSKLVFGGLQLIAAGSFKQLPPVPDLWKGDDGTQCFISENFQPSFPHHIHLTQVQRQNETELMLAVDELCDGVTSTATDQLLASLSRPIEEPNASPVYLVGTNLSATMVNIGKLESNHGNIVHYKAIETGKHFKYDFYYDVTLCVVSI